MSAKWVRSKQWDDEHIPGWAWPLRFLLRTFSGIPLAVCLLSCVVIYATLASVPIGLLALAPTYLLYALTVAGAAALLAVLPATIWWRMSQGRAALGSRFSIALLMLLGLGALALWVWGSLLWPMLQYDPARHTGVRLFAGFVERYGSTTLRRLPGMEQSELEFYGWWPLRLILVLFVLNMITATVRRIEFTFPHLGVLTVHTGIVTIALGSLYYNTLKQEGDTLLLGGASASPDGMPLPGPPQAGFYDNTRVSLWAKQGATWEQRRIAVPRYNDYGLSAGAESALSAATIVGRGNAPGLDAGRTLDRAVPRPAGAASRLDADLSFRIVGYASYADPAPDYVAAPPPTSGPANPLRFVSLRGRPPAGSTGEARKSSEYAFYFLPDRPAGRVSVFKDDDGQPVFALEYTRGMPESRWQNLGASLPEGAAHALAVTVRGAGDEPFRALIPVEAGARVPIGSTGYSIEVKQVLPTPPFPLITEGYRGAESSVAVLRITPPTGSSFDRYVYHRFPEISQDLLDELGPSGMPRRRDADPGIRIEYLDASMLQLYIDEREDGSVRAMIRLPGGGASVIGQIAEGGVARDILPRPNPDKDPILDLVFGARWPHAEALERPQVVPEPQRDKAQVGTHEHAMLAVEVAAKGSFRRVVWLPFTKYLGVNMGTERTLSLPDGRTLSLAFGRLRHGFPDFMIQLVDFQMIAYDHRGAPRDYQSVIRVIPAHGREGPQAFKPYTHMTKLNNPLQAPFEWSEDRRYIPNVVGTIASRLSARQFKLSQAGWDAEGWKRTQQMADQGLLPRPYASFTILGVGNNPGIHIIAAGAVMVCCGIPWAFYVKPLIVKRRKRKLQEQLAAGAVSRLRHAAPTTIESFPAAATAGEGS
jgi:hypothetical protein